MASKDKIKQWINRIQYALDAIPAGQDGTGGPSLSVEGIRAFQNDIQEFRRSFRQFGWALQEDNDKEGESYVVEIEALAKRAREAVTR